MPLIGSPSSISMRSPSKSFDEPAIRIILPWTTRRSPGSPMSPSGNMTTARSADRTRSEDAMNFTIEVETEEDGRWIAEVLEIPGVMAYGPTRAEAVARVQALALRVLADRLEHGEGVPDLSSVFSI